MKENFPSQNNQEQKGVLLEQEKPLFIKGILAKLNQCKEYFKRKKIDLKLGAMILLSMGVFEIVQGQGMSNFDDAIKKVDLDKNKITNVVDSFYSSQKEIINSNDDSTFSIFEFSESIKDSKNKGNIKMKSSGIVFNIENIGDTISFGNIEAKNLFVKMGVTTQNIEKESINEEYRFFSAIKINAEENGNDLSPKENSNISFGKTPEQAVISAISDAITSKKVLVSAVTHSSKEESNTTTTESSFEDKFIELTLIKSHEILKNVRIIVKKMSRKNFKDFKLPYNKDTRNYYLAEVIYM